MLPEEKARIKIDKQLINAGWDIVSRNEYVPNSTSAVKEALMQGNTESDYLLFVEDKAIAVVEAKKGTNPLGAEVERQAEGYAVHPQSWYGLWYEGLIPLVYMASPIFSRWKGSGLMQIDPKKLIGEATEYDKRRSVERKKVKDWLNKCKGQLC